MNPPGLPLPVRPMALGLAILIAGLPLRAAPRKPLTPATGPARREATPPLPAEPGRVHLIAWRYGFPAVDRGGLELDAMGDADGRAHHAPLPYRDKLLSVVPAPGSGGQRPVEVRLPPGFRY